MLLDRVRIGQVLGHERRQLVARMRFERRAHRHVDVRFECLHHRPLLTADPARCLNDVFVSRPLCHAT
jgi:hypothetical protein